MALLAICYPTLSAGDYEWIQAIRKAHDPNYRIARPHFTLVFPIENVSKREFVEHIETQGRGASAIEFWLRCAVVVGDAAARPSSIFLVPDEGHGAIVKLHDRLYGGILAPELRLDIPFIPHITVGADLDGGKCKRIADELNEQDISIEGKIETLSVVSYDGNEVTELRQLPLT